MNFRYIVADLVRVRGRLQKKKKYDEKHELYHVVKTEKVRENESSEFYIPCHFIKNVEYLYTSC